jgi:F0F1-type ATP synthase assembly protein I
MTDRPNDNEQAERRLRARRQGLAYQGAFEAVVAILIAMGAGYWVDTRYETSPYGLLIGTAVGFASFVLRLLRLGRRIQELSEADAADGNDASR